MMKGIIYKITNPDNQIYIGQTINFRVRMTSYKTAKCSTQPKLYNSLLEYGFKNHKVEILFIIPVEYLDKMETKCIQLHDSYNKGLNCTKDGAAPMRGLKHSQETKLEMSRVRKGVKRIFSEDHKKALSIGIKNSFLKGRVAYNTGKHLSNITKEKIRQDHLGKKASIETRKKISLGGMNRIVSEKTRLKKSLSMRKVTPDIIQIVLLKIKEGIKIKEIMKLVNLSRSVISNIKNKGMNYSKYIK